MANNQVLRTYQVANSTGSNLDSIIAGIGSFINVSVNSGSTISGQTTINLVNSYSTLINVSQGSGSNVNVSVNNIVRLIVPLSDTITPLTSLVGTNIAYVHAPRTFTVTNARASLIQAGNSGAVTGQTNVQVTINGNDLFAPLLTIDNAAVTSIGSAVTPVLSNVVVADDSTIKYSIVNAGGNAIGLIVTLYGI